jgi:hypothetical protein
MRLRPETSPEVEKLVNKEKTKTQHVTDEKTFDEPIPSFDEQLGKN